MRAALGCVFPHRKRRPRRERRSRFAIDEPERVRATPERGAEIREEQTRRATMLVLVDRGEWAHETLILRLVVAICDERSEEAQRIDLRARGEQ